MAEVEPEVGGILGNLGRVDRNARDMNVRQALAFAAAALVSAETPASPVCDEQYITPGADARFTAPLDEQLSNPRKLGRPRLFRQRTSKSAPDDVDAMTTVTSFASSTRASSGRVVTNEGTTTPERTPASPPEQVAGLAERRSKRSAVVRLASAPLLDVDDEPLSP